MTLQNPILPQTADADLIARAIVDATDLRRATRLAREVTHRWNIMPVLQCSLLTIANGVLELRATDLDTYVAQAIEAEITGSHTVPVRTATLASFAAAASGRVTIELRRDPDGMAPAILCLRDGDLVARHRCMMPASDFPEQPVASGQSLSWDQSQGSLQRMISLTQHCISRKETRYYLNGVFLTTKPGGNTLRAVATDGHRLACVDSDVVADFTAMQAESSGANPGVIVPAPLMKMLAHLVKKGGNQPLRVTVGQNLMTLTLPGLCITAKMIDGTYPDYTRVIPASDGRIDVHLNRGQIARLSRVSSGLDDPFSARAARIDPAAKTLSVVCDNGSTVAMPVQITIADDAQPPKPFGFALPYLRAQASATPEFTLRTRRPGDPALILGEDPEALFVLMPMRI